MRQITQKLKNGEIHVKEVPFSLNERGGIVVRNIYSCISIGTESGKVRAARKGYVGKAKERPQQFKQVLEKLGQDGPLHTYRAVMKKLDALSPLGYSCVGEVIDVSPDVENFSIGDLAACGGSTANHAEIVSVPKNLCVKIPADIDLKHAAYNTLGAIAMQGIRQADLRLGETCAVIGLGVVGQLTCNLLQAAGVRTIGIDIDEKMVAIARENCVDLACLRQEPGIEQRILSFASGQGVDAVIITASSDSLDPINFAGSISRKKGTIVVVGGVPTGFEREPHYYNKELSVKMSCSYGPGRYDQEYEEKGRDYPFAYVRWTEKRNMQAFQELIADGKINLQYLTTHIFKLEDVPKAYSMILNKKESYLGILIEYDHDNRIENTKIEICKTQAVRPHAQEVCIGFIGAGSYAQGFLLPNILKDKDIVRKAILTKSSTGSRSAAEKFGFEFCTSNVDDILSCSEINTIFIATRHDTHGRYVIEALENGKNVFVEKPICIAAEELDKINELMNSNRANGEQGLLMVGYNRRFSPLTKELKANLRPGPVSMIYRINAGYVPSESWAQDLDVGGGRIIGEVCHFIDFLTFICDSLPISIYALVMEEASNNKDTLSVSINYENGSIASIHYFANGSKLVHKEYVEIYQNGTTAIMNDFRRLSFFRDGKSTNKKLPVQNKGQKGEIQAFIKAVRNNDSSIMPFNQIYSTSNVSFKIIESLRLSSSINL